MRRIRRQALSVVAAVEVVLLAAGMVPVATATEHTDSGLVVDLHEDGSATVTLRTTYDLTSESEAQAFDELRNDAESRESLLSNYRDRMDRVASKAATETGREMTVSGADIAFDTSDEVGVVTLSVRWERLAATDDGQLVVTSPFAGDFETDRSLTVVEPEGYEVVETTPSADSQNGRRLTWAPGTDLSGFEVTFRQTDGTGPSGSSDGNADTGVSAPGFGVVVAVVALMVVGVFVRKRS